MDRDYYTKTLYPMELDFYNLLKNEISYKIYNKQIKQIPDNFEDLIYLTKEIQNLIYKLPTKNIMVTHRSKLGTYNFITKIIVVSNENIFKLLSQIDSFSISAINSEDILLYNWYNNDIKNLNDTFKNIYLSSNINCETYSDIYLYYDSIKNATISWSIIGCALLYLPISIISNKFSKKQMD